MVLEEIVSSRNLYVKNINENEVKIQMIERSIKVKDLYLDMHGLIFETSV